jgi:hypothetical protein
MGDNMKRFICLVVVCLLLVIIGCESTNEVKPVKLVDKNEKVHGVPTEVHLYDDGSRLILFTNNYLATVKDAKAENTFYEHLHFGVVIKEDANGKELWRYPDLNSILIGDMKVVGDKIVLTSSIDHVKQTTVRGVVADDSFDSVGELIVLNSNGAKVDTLSFPTGMSYLPSSINLTVGGKLLIGGETSNNKPFIAVASLEQGIEAVSELASEDVRLISFQGVDDDHFLSTTTSNSTDVANTKFTQYVIDKGKLVIAKTWDSLKLGLLTSEMESKDILYGFTMSNTFVRVRLTSSSTVKLLKETEVPIDGLFYLPKIKKVDKGYIVLTSQNRVNPKVFGPSTIYEGHALYLDSDGSVVKDTRLLNVTGSAVSFDTEKDKSFYVGTVKSIEPEVTTSGFINSEALVSGFLNN